MANAQMLATAIAQRQEAIQKLNAEIEQHKGAHAYNNQVIEYTQKQLADLAAQSESIRPSQ